jgi:hypothetical protein
MKKLTISLIVLLISFTTAFGQTSNDSITLKKVVGGYQFFYKQKRQNINQLVKIMEPDQQARDQMLAAQATNTLATIISCAGGFMVGWPIGTYIGGGKPNWVLAGIGAGLIVVSIPISQKFCRQSKEAVDTYNSGLSPTTFRDRNELKFSVTGNGATVTLRF